MWGSSSSEEEKYIGKREIRTYSFDPAKDLDSNSDEIIRMNSPEPKYKSAVIGVSNAKIRGQLSSQKKGRISVLFEDDEKSNNCEESINAFESISLQELNAKYGGMIVTRQQREAYIRNRVKKNPENFKVSDI